VTNSQTHGPIRKATVSMTNDLGFSRLGQTDESGKFQIPNAEPGNYHVEYIRAPGYFYQPSGRKTQIAVAEDQAVTGIALELIPLGAISGKVVDDAGEPLIGAQVAIMAYGYSTGARVLESVDGALTDDRGQYRVFHLKPGRYFVHAWLPVGGQPHEMLGALPLNTHRNIVEMAYAPVFYPDATDVSQATATLLTPGGDVNGIDFRLRSVPGYHIRGQVANLPDSQQASVVASPCNAAGQPSLGAQYLTRIEAGALFDLGGVVPGGYCLAVGVNGFGQKEYANGIVTVTNRGVDGVRLMLEPKFPISGTVQADGQSVDLPPFSISLDGSSLMTGMRAFQNAGKFVIPAVAPGDYHLKVSGLLPGAYLKSFHYGTEDASDGLIHVRSGAPALTLQVGLDAGHLGGTVQTAAGAPAVNLPVTIAPAGHLANRRDLIRSIFTDDTGRFQVEDLAPGDYQAYAWDDPDVPMAVDAAFRQAFFTQSTAVTVAATAQTSVQLKLIPADDIRKVKERF
jgi:hypothetical protein